MTYIWQNQLHLYEIRYIYYTQGMHIYGWIMPQILRLHHLNVLVRNIDMKRRDPWEAFAPSTLNPLLYQCDRIILVFFQKSTHIVTYHLIVPVLFPQRTGMQKILDPKFMSRWNHFHPFQKLPIPISPPFGKDGCSKNIMFNRVF